MRYLTIISLFVCSFNAAYAAGAKLDPALKDIDSNQSVEVIVQFRNAPTETQHRLVLAHRGQLKENLGIIRAAHYSVPGNQLKALSEEVDVEFIAPDRELRATSPTSPGPGQNIYTGPSRLRLGNRGSEFGHLRSRFGPAIN